MGLCQPQSIRQCATLTRRRVGVAVCCGDGALLLANRACSIERLHSANPYLNGLIFIALWLVMEWSLTWLLTGFPWLFLGYGAIDSVLAGVAPVAGVLATSAFGLVSAVGVALFGLLYVQGRRGELLLPSLALVGLPWIIGALLSSVSLGAAHWSIFGRFGARQFRSGGEMGPRRASSECP